MRAPARRLFATGSVFVLALCACQSGASRARSEREGELPRYLDAPNFTILAAGIAGSGQPDLALFPGMAERGYSTVVNLRTSGEAVPEGEEEAARAAGLAYFSVPMRGGQMTLADAGRLQVALDKAPGGAVLIHCASGNRVGAAWGLYRALSEGLDAEAAVRAAREGGMRSEMLADRVRSEVEAASF